MSLRKLSAVVALALVATTAAALVSPQTALGQQGGPSVTVVNTPLPVDIAATPAHPIWVRDVDSAPRDVARINLFTDMPAGSTFLSSLPFAVPADKQLVIEHGMTNLQLDPGVKPLTVLVGCRVPGQQLRTTDLLLPEFQATTSLGTEFFAASQVMRTYCQPGESVYVSVSLNAPNTRPLATNVSLSGYLVPVSGTAQ